MKPKFTLTALSLFITLCILQNKNLFAITCDPGNIGVAIIIDPDYYPSETSWEIRDADGISIASGDYNSDSLCVTVSTCYTFYLYDSYGDGIDIGYGSVKVYYNGVLLTTFTGDFGTETSIDMGCPAGTTCGSAFTVDLGTYTAEGPNTWYAFTPADTGTYIISTCGLDNTCDTKIWVYDYCTGLVPTEFAEGTTYYNDNACDLFAEVSAILLPGETYYIRIGDAGASCDSTPINWSITYEGPPMGCTDPYACNYNPLALESDGSCIYPGDPACPSGPDLTIDETYFDGVPATGWDADFTVTTYNADFDDCALTEECVTGPGLRYVMEFNMKINNIGDQDYHIGSPGGGAPGFVYSTCHAHWHYADYGEFSVYDSTGTEIPAGHKNGYAVMDVGCFDGTGGYGGWDMGISAGCYDMYGKGTTCQWVDLTDIPDGTYTLVARVNWQNNPDVDGNVETNLANNWVSRCFKITRLVAGGEPTITIVDDCLPYYDCYGEIFGTATPDCNGICGGPSLVGDLNTDLSRTSADVDAYINSILTDTIAAESCNDANGDGNIDVNDAALVSGCSWEGMGVTHIISLCDLPHEFSNETDSVTFSIGAVDPDHNYLDLYALNPSADILAFQLKLSGITIDSVVNLAPSIAGKDFRYAHNDNEIIGLGYDESAFVKNFVSLPLARVYYHTTYPATICIYNVTTAVNKDYQKVTALKNDACFTVTGAEDIVLNNNMLNVKVIPNPFTNEAKLTFNNYLNEPFTLKLFDITGTVVKQFEPSYSNSFIVERNNLPPGIYTYQLQSGKTSQQGKIIIL